ncbi:hypothetical protein B0T10DRAFT_557011 [Thelonectria olida]|uniref:Uncharacterized protein n=1 Tax=Thelonectria olida TaxID=1576542 RepID=A0A9P9AUZ7_9HYPO|nr:hypothetical protein B0T10DRAFT_557011 [Thelonectria olida]
MEHLAAGSKTIDQKATQDEWSGVSTAVPNRLRVQEHPRDHSLARDGIATVSHDVPPHSQSLDVKEPEPAPTIPHPLTSDDTAMVDNGLSPRSHSIPQDVHTEVRELVKPHSITQDPGFEENERDMHSPREDLPPLKSPTPELMLYDPDEPLPADAETLDKVEATRSRPSQRPEKSQHSRVVFGHTGFRRRQDFLSPGPGVLKLVKDRRKNSGKEPVTA